MRFNRFLHLIAFSGKAHGDPPASGCDINKMPETPAPSQAMAKPSLSRYIPLSGGFPPAPGETQQAELKAAVQELPEAAGTGWANWNWKVVHQLVPERFGISLSRSGCLTPYQVRGDVTACTGWGLPSSVPRSGW